MLDFGKEEKLFSLGPKMIKPNFSRIFLSFFVRCFVSLHIRSHCENLISGPSLDLANGSFGSSSGQVNCGSG